ncbi:MEDS domain-containing protein [Planococcus alpniumensis]|uniref:MEDS domain-containing protein n=1 Tax=Planococcus alpniumensis TaxID=2708345 RepID=UPI001B8D8580|nr:MEDS domain-containing protein [Planococcus sp. MSAK28401]
MRSKMDQLLESQCSVHVLYAFDGTENYVKQLLNYIDEGIHAGDHILIVENERMTRELKRHMEKQYTEKQLKMVHFVNSLHFYWSSGSYHPPAIHEYFTKTVAPYIENKLSFRSWAHVEWESVKEPLFLIEDFEKIADRAVNEFDFPLVCAYEKKKMPVHLRESLMKTHPYVLMEDELIASPQYQSMSKQA